MSFKIFPDFSVEGQVVEIKSKPFMDMLINGVGKNKEKYECIKRNNVVIINNALRLTEENAKWL